MDDAPEIPLATASFLSQLGFMWIQPLLVLGFKRPLVAEDLCKMDAERQSGYLADLFEKNFARRKLEVEEWNRALDDGSMAPSWARRTWWKVWARTSGLCAADGKRTVGMALALSDTLRWTFWSAGVIKVVGDLAGVCTPLLTKQIIYFVTDAAYYKQGVAGYTNPSVGKGIGLALALFILQSVYSFCTAHMLSRAGQCGVLARAALIAAVYRRAMVLSGKSRVKYTNAQIVNYISTDISRIDFASSFFHFSWTAAIQLIEIMVILLVNLGVSSLVGVALVVVAMPLQTYAMRQLFRLRRKSMVWTDRRIKMISELLSGIKVIKAFAWEQPYLAKVHEYRKKELVGIRHLLYIRAGNLALAMSIPLLASVLVFVTYSLTGHGQSPALIWTTISLLQLLRMPMMMLPNALGTSVDAKNAMDRLIGIFTCETLEETFLIDLEAKHALLVTDASFEWETSAPAESTPPKGSSSDGRRGKKVPKAEIATISSEELAPPSRIHDFSLAVPRGELWMICGPVGSGKSSLMQGLISEMRKTSGEVIFGGTIGYCAQTAWIQNTTVRDNILFGRPFEEDRYWRCIRDSCLMPDLEMLPNGDMTQIGEKGIALSGGQRQRVSICRTLYFDADTILLDDPLSALDAHVGSYIMEHVVLGSLAHKTRILATHALHLMPAADHIICLENGGIAERGTYAELMAAGGQFARLSREYGGARKEADSESASAAVKAEEDEDEKKAKQDSEQPAKGIQGGLMQVEERVVGGVSGSVYKDLFIAAHGWFTVPLVVVTMILMQSAQVLSQFELTWWQDYLFGTSEGFYMGLYAGLGVASTLFLFLMGVSAVTFGVTASKNIHRHAIESVLQAPMRFFESTPLGRIQGRFAKDVDNMDNRLNDSSRMSLVVLAQIGGSFITIAIVQQYFLIAVAAAVICVWSVSGFYRESAREIKRLDNILRSSLYALFSESLSGLATIRAYGETARYKFDIEKLIDLENRAYLLTVINQRYLGIRLDFVGAILTLIISLIAVGQRYTISPSLIGLILSSVLSIQQSLSMVVRQTAEVANDLTSVERLQFYASSVEHEAPSVLPDSRPPPSWPSEGRVEFNNVVMGYRPELPPVLKNVSFAVRPGEKVGIVGRTGAGKSTIFSCLFRLIELTSGSITIDDLDISQMGLRDLRKRLAIIPQEALLFNGTLRTNLDPFGVYEDAILWSALKRSWLVERTSDVADETFQASRFTLDTVIEDEGLNMSVGERSLVSLARALVKDSRIVVLDEATASVDFETDARIQRTIRAEFSSKTLIVIAHRLNTIIGYDRVLVVDKGEISAFDTPADLFEAGGIFHGLCVESGLTLEDIRKSAFKGAEVDEKEKEQV